MTSKPPEIPPNPTVVPRAYLPNRLGKIPGGSNQQDKAWSMPPRPFAQTERHLAIQSAGKSLRNGKCGSFASPRIALAAVQSDWRALQFVDEVMWAFGARVGNG